MGFKVIFWVVEREEGVFFLESTLAKWMHLEDYCLEPPKKILVRCSRGGFSKQGPLQTL